jgi:hypothetical protein
MLPWGVADAFALVLAFAGKELQKPFLCQQMNTEFGEMLAMSSGFGNEK